MLQERDIFKLLGSFISNEVRKQLQSQLQPVMTALDTLQKQMQICETKTDAKREQIDVTASSMYRYVDQRFVEARDFAATQKHDTCQWTREYVAGALDALPKPERGEQGANGVDGRDGIDGKDGVDGKDGKDGKDAEIPWDYLNEQLSAGGELLNENLTKLFTDKFNALPKPKDGADGADGLDGTNGKDGLNGKDGKDGKDGVDGQDGAPGKDGKDGANGADGQSVQLDDLRDDIAAAVAEAVRVLPVPVHPVSGFIDRAGCLHFTNSDGSTFAAGQVVGRDGKDGAPGPQGEPGTDGIDGLGLEQIEYDGERTFRLANEKVDRSFVIPFPIYKGLWKPGAYVQGDEVTSDGSQFIAMRDTDKEPGTLDSGWRLACKRGQNGRDGRSAK